MSVTKYLLDKRVFKSAGGPVGTGSLENLDNKLNLYNYIKEVIEDDQTDLSIGSGITASTTQTQTAATLLDDYTINIVDTVANSGDAVKLPLAQQGGFVVIKNDGAEPLQVFPNTSDTIDGGSADASVTIPVNDTWSFYAKNTTDWQTDSQSVSVSDGVVGDPSITFRSDNDSGFYLIAAGQVGATIGGTQVAYFDSNGLYADSVRPRVALGTAGTNVTAVHYGDGRNFTTVLTLSAVSYTIAGAADEAVGSLIYTFPAGAHSHKTTYMSVALQGGGTVDADTPDVGIGSVTGSGANATLDAVGATCEDYITGQTATDCGGTATVAHTAATAGVLTGISLNASGDVKTVYLNLADGWAGADTVTATGTVVLEWTLMA